MKKIISLLIISTLAGAFSSCSEAETESDTSKSESNQVSTEDTTTVETETDSITLDEFVLASNGLEYKAAQHYLEKYTSGNMRSVVNGVPEIMNPEEHTIYIENTLYDNSNLGFFHGKYPEFLETPKQPATASSFKSNDKVNCEGFKDLNALDFFDNKDDYHTQDLLLIFSKAFYHEGAYYVHVWQMSNDKIIHQREATYKFDGTGEIVNQSYKNYYQLGYSSIESFLEKIQE